MPLSRESDVMFCVDLPDSRVEVRGASWLEETDAGLLPHRLPQWTQVHYPDAFFRLNVIQPSGVRLRFTTAASTLTLHVAVSRTTVLLPTTTPDLIEASEAVAEPAAPEPFDLVIDGELIASATAPQAGVMVLDFEAGTVVDEPGPTTPVSFDLPLADAPRTVEIWLPYREHVRLVALEADAEIVAAPVVSAPRWVHYGSSISHGAQAASPFGIWPAVAATAAGVDLVNLGFSGAACLDPFVARAIRDEPADVISLKVGINILNGDTFGRRMFRPLLHGFLDTIREGHPETPIVLASPIFCPIGETVPGPTGIDPNSPVTIFRTNGKPEDAALGKLHLRAMREIIASVVDDRRALGDENLHYVDGLDLYGQTDWTVLPMADLLHPDPPAQRLMGMRFAPILQALLP